MIFVKAKDGKVTITYNMYMDANLTRRNGKGKGNVPFFLDVQKAVLNVD